MRFARRDGSSRAWARLARLLGLRLGSRSRRPAPWRPSCGRTGARSPSSGRRPSAWAPSAPSRCLALGCLALFGLAPERDLLLQQRGSSRAPARPRRGSGSAGSFGLRRNEISFFSSEAFSGSGRLDGVGLGLAAAAPARRSGLGLRLGDGLQLLRSPRRAARAARCSSFQSIASPPRPAGPRRARRHGVGRNGEAGALEQAEQLLGPARARERDVERDHAAQGQVGERLLHRLHALGGPGLHDRVDLLDLRLADQVPHGVVGKEDLEGGHTAIAVGGREQRLGDDALERGGELDANLLLLRRREGVDDAVDRPGRALRVQRARRRGGRSRPRSARSRSSRGRASRRGGSRRGPGGARRGAPRRSWSRRRRSRAG